MFLGTWADKQKHAANVTLELRRVPSDMNNIAKINEHFARFGTLVNLQVWCFLHLLYRYYLYPRRQVDATA